MSPWRETLAALLTYCAVGEREDLANRYCNGCFFYYYNLLLPRLGQRLQAAGQGEEAILAFCVAGEMDRLVEAWLEGQGGQGTASAAQLQQLLEVAGGYYYCSLFCSRW